MNEYEFDCECCQALRIPGGPGRKRFHYVWNGLEFSDQAEWAHSIGMPLPTLRKRLERGFCLRASRADLREELIANRAKMLSESDPCSMLATAFLRVMARTF